MNVILIHNPGAGDSHTPDAEKLQRMIEKAGHMVRYQSSKSERWVDVLKNGSDLVVVAGGDGTVARVARRLIGRRLPMSVLSMGTANNISRSLGIAELTFEEQIAGWTKGHRLELDAGTASGPWGERSFIEGLGLGLFAWVMPRADQDKKLLGMDDADDAISYAVKMLRKRLRDHPAKRVNADLDGTDISGEYLLFEAMNMQYIGPNLYLAPKGRPADGFLDIVVVPGSAREELDNYLADWQKRRLSPPEFPTFRGRCLKIKGNHSLHIDDKLIPVPNSSATGGPAITVKIVPAALEFVIPV